MGVVQNHFYHAVKVITLRKNLFKKKKFLCNSVHLDRQNDVKFNMFRCLIPLIWMTLL